MVQTHKFLLRTWDGVQYGSNEIVSFSVVSSVFVKDGECGLKMLKN